MIRKVFMPLALLASPISTVCMAQANAVDAVLNGYVQDSSNGALADATATLTNVQTGVTQVVTTDPKGYYRFPLVPVGVYQLTISSPGFSISQQQGITLAVGQDARLDVTLQVGSLSDSVTVTAKANGLDLEASTVGAILDKGELEKLPIPSRNLYNEFLLAPGAIGNPTSTFSTTQLTFGGTERAQWNLDGLDDSQHGTNRQIRLVIVSTDAVSATQTLANGYPAEFGRAAGGQINVVLKSGTNELHGSAIGQYRPADLQAIPTLLYTQPDRTWYDYGFTLGGPILKDRLFFFGQYEDNPYTLPNSISITPANAAALGIPSSEIGSSPFGETYRTLVGKVDYSVNARNSGYVRYARFTNHQPNNISGLSIVDRGLSFLDHQNTGGAAAGYYFLKQPSQRVSLWWQPTRYR